jgi:hypothetical protein
MFEFSRRRPGQPCCDAAAATRRFQWRTFASLVIVLASWPACAQQLTEARYIEPVNRYGHFALGRPHEYAAVTATTEHGKRLTFDLAADEVFEDVVPRVVRLYPGGGDELLVIVSNRNTGARLALIGQVGGRLVFSAQSAPIGTAMRWLNPVGNADLDGDGEAEIAAVITPHIGGILKVYRRVGGKLVEIAALEGFSNHTYGSPEQALSIVASIDGRPQLVVPDLTRRALRLIALQEGRLAETSRCPLKAPITGQLRLQAPALLRMFTAAGPITIDISACTPSLLPTQTKGINHE